MIATEQPELPQLPRWEWVVLIFILVIAVIVLSLSKCENPEPININAIEKKGVIGKQKRIADSLDKRSDITDSIRIVYVERWHKIKGRVDTIPCPEALAEVIVLTDSIITVDSTLISQLNGELFIKDLIIANQDTLIKKDSVRIASQEKKIRKLKFWNRLFKVTTVIAVAAAAVK